MTEKKSNHQANVVRIGEVLTHTNADTLEIIHIDGYQCVVKKGQFKAGDLAVYIQPDSVVPQTEPFRFIWGPYAEERELTCADPAGILGTPERRRRVTVRKFRGEWSEGLLMPVSDFPDIAPTARMFKDPCDENKGIYVKQFNELEGHDVSDLLGITHYDPDNGRESTSGHMTGAPRRRYPRTLKGWFFFVLHKLGFKKAGLQLTEEVSFNLPVYDVDSFKRYKNILEPDESVIVTEKIHGSNARYVFLDGKMYAGSHKFWKAPTSNCVWRKALAQNAWIEEWCRSHEGYALYGEVTPTQKGFNYGCRDGEVKLFVFDIRTPDDHWQEFYGPDGALSAPYADLIALGGYLSLVPQFYTGPFTTDAVAKFTDGPSSVIGAKHAREGIVIKPRHERRVPGMGRVILKVVSNSFLEKDSK